LAGVDGAAFTSSTVLGAKVGSNFMGQLTWYYHGKFNLSAANVTPTGQTSVGAYSTFDLYMQYDFKKSSVPIILSLGITNMFDANPPVYTGTNTNFGKGYANGATLGRVFQVGASIKF
ncbi:MAG: hypothetical protein KGJ05_05180, partial [Alphaproteobacteria bacterium]|nr:hypothetical protein [Alphaproteobacteria bacterium]